jgi:hypothetical protein
MENSRRAPTDGLALVAAKTVHDDDASARSVGSRICSKYAEALAID